ncbi:hypothetical protein [Kitasatospora purpeofusca]|uniref:hypothetical protein n=1 Tax=Kitasatospora purpeofusca TaxID=67352 RepID=UPI003668011E
MLHLCVAVSQLKRNLASSVLHRFAVEGLFGAAGEGVAIRGRAARAGGVLTSGSLIE